MSRGRNETRTYPRKVIGAHRSCQAHVQPSQVCTRSLMSEILPQSGRFLACVGAGRCDHWLVAAAPTRLMSLLNGQSNERRFRTVAAEAGQAAIRRLPVLLCECG